MVDKIIIMIYNDGDKCMFEEKNDMSKEQERKNTEAEKEYERLKKYYGKMNASKWKYAKEEALDKCLNLYEKWLKNYSDCDIIVQPEVELDEAIKTDNRIKKSNIYVDTEYLVTEEEYDVTNVRMGMTKEDTDGSGSGYTISETSDGYSVSSNYTPKYETVKYVYTEDGTETADACIRAKAVKRGCLDVVIQKERELGKNFKQYQAAKTYKKSPKSFIAHTSGLVKAYNILCVLQAIGVILSVVLFELMIFANSTLFLGAYGSNTRAFFVENLIAGGNLPTLTLPFNVQKIIFITLAITGVLWISLAFIDQAIDEKRKKAASNQGVYSSGKATSLFDIDRRWTRSTKSYLAICIPFLICILLKVPILHSILSGIVGMITGFVINLTRIIAFIVGIIQLIISIIKLNKDPFRFEDSKIKMGVTAFLRSEKFQRCIKLEGEIKKYTVHRKTGLTTESVDFDDADFPDYNKIKK